MRFCTRQSSHMALCLARLWSFITPYYFGDASRVLRIIFVREGWFMGSIKVNCVLSIVYLLLFLFWVFLSVFVWPAFIFPNDTVLCIKLNTGVFQSYSKLYWMKIAKYKNWIRWCPSWHLFVHPEIFLIFWILSWVGMN